MRAVIQRVSKACVTVDGETVGGIDVGKKRQLKT
jgi:D-Tyr-tRNAtyr deacylase